MGSLACNPRFVSQAGRERNRALGKYDIGTLLCKTKREHFCGSSLESGWQVLLKPSRDVLASDRA